MTAIKIFIDNTIYPVEIHKGQEVALFSCQPENKPPKDANNRCIGLHWTTIQAVSST